MHDLYYDLKELCETAADEIHKSNDKIKKAGGQINMSDLEFLDGLTHMIKSIKTTTAMMEAEEDGYSFDDGRMMDNRGASYARGRGRYAKRDSMGRYASENRAMGMGRSYDDVSYDGMMYDRSYDGDMISELHVLMDKAPNQNIRQKFKNLINEFESMK